jgi:hypothetical protein
MLKSGFRPYAADGGVAGKSPGAACFFLASAACGRSENLHPRISQRYSTTLLWNKIAQKNGKSKLRVKEMGVHNDFAKSFRHLRA